MSEQERNNAPGGPAQGPEKPPRGGKEGRAALDVYKRQEQYEGL